MRPATIIISDDEFLASAALEEIRREADEAGFAREELAGADAHSLIYALGTPSLFDAGRLIVVPDAQDLPKEAVEVVVRWAADPGSGVSVVLVAEANARADKLAKALGSAAQVVKATAPAPWETAKWLAARVRQHGRRISPEAAQALVDAVGTDLRELAAAAAQLLAESEGSIDIALVQSRFQGLESKVYEFVDAVLERDRTQALLRLRSLIENGENPVGIVVQLGRQLRIVAAVKDGERRPAEAIARDLGARPGQVKRAFRQARNFEPHEIRRAFKLLADADLALKSETQDELLLDLVVEELTGPA